jgi:hypothetical protein
MGWPTIASFPHSPQITSSVITEFMTVLDQQSNSLKSGFVKYDE